MIGLICVIGFFIVAANLFVFLYMFFDHKIKQLDEEIAKLEEQKKILEESAWGWESEFLKIEFINVKFRNEFDAELKKIKEREEYQEDLADAIPAIWQLIENCDSEGMKYDEEELNQSIWDYVQE